MISSCTGSTLVTTVALLPLGLVLELFQATRPERLQMPYHFADCLRVRLIDPRSPLPPLGEQAGVAENGQVLGHGRASRVEVSSYFPGRKPSQGDELDDAATGGVGQCAEC